MSTHIWNPFLKAENGLSYHHNRPHFHEIPFSSVKNFIKDKVERALDVACGTGHSTNALEELAKEVHGIDQSHEMIRIAKKSFPHISFSEGKAEVLPFENQYFDLVNISMGLHWVEHHQFFKEVSRVLKNEAYFIIDNYGFEGVISHQKIDQDEHFEFFKNFLPSADKNKSYGAKGLLKVNSLRLVKEDRYKKTIKMNREEFIKFLQTTSNFLILADKRKDEVLKEMEQVYRKIFEGNFLELGFGGEFKIYQKQV